MGYRKILQHRKPLTGTGNVELPLGNWRLTSYDSHVYFHIASYAVTLTGAATEDCDLIPRDFSDPIQITKSGKVLSYYVPAGGRLYLSRRGKPEQGTSVSVSIDEDSDGRPEHTFNARPV